MPSDELPHTPYVLSYSHPSSAHRSVDMRCHGVGGGNGGGEGGGEGGVGDGGGGRGAVAGWYGGGDGGSPTPQTPSAELKSSQYWPG